LNAGMRARTGSYNRVLLRAVSVLFCLISLRTLITSLTLLRGAPEIAGSYGVTAGILFAIAYGLWRSPGWARASAIAGSALAILSACLNSLHYPFTVRSLVSVLVAAGVIIICARRTL